MVKNDRKNLLSEVEKLKLKVKGSILLVYGFIPGKNTANLLGKADYSKRMAYFWEDKRTDTIMHELLHLFQFQHEETDQYHIMYSQDTGLARLGQNFPKEDCETLYNYLEWYFNTYPSCPNDKTCVNLN